MLNWLNGASRPAPATRDDSANDSASTGLPLPPQYVLDAMVSAANRARRKNPSSPYPSDLLAASAEYVHWLLKR